MNLLYNIALHLLGLIAIPKVLYDLVKRGKYKKSLLKRLGKGFPKIEKGNRPLIWIHAVSLGETKATAPLVEKLKQLPNPPVIVLSTATETGEKEGRTSAPKADYHVYLPLDLPYLICPIVSQVAPDMVLLTETDFWLNFQNAAVKRGAKLVLINGKISENSYKRLKRTRLLAKQLLGSFHAICVQGPLYQKRFLELGVPREKITVSGNIKLDNFTASKEGEALKKRLGILESDIVFTCGSTHDPEEKILLQALKTLLITFPQLKLILVPRHPDRFNQIASLLDEMGLPYVRYSSNEPSLEKRIILMDVMGQLRACYQISYLAFVGGSFTPKVGGHNILEPCFYGVPTLFGPHMHSQPDFLDLIKNYDAGREVLETNLTETIATFLQNKNFRDEMGQRGLKLIEESRGAIEATMKVILEQLPLLQKTTE